MKEDTKTILEWFHELPEPYRTQAIENFNKEKDFLPLRKIRRKLGSLQSALFSSFTWCMTPQGHQYWSELHQRLLDSEEIESPTPTGWQPIATAPKDGTIVLACSRNHYIPQSVCWASYHPNAKGKECWRTSAIGGNKAEGLSHWMPLPEPPSVD